MPRLRQDALEVGGVERALAGLVEDHLAGRRRELVDDVVAVSPRTRMRPFGPWSPIPSSSLPRASLAGGQSERSGRWPSRVWTISMPGGAGRLEHGRERARWPARSRLTSLPSSLAEAARLEEVALHVDQHQRGGAGVIVNGYGSAVTSNAVVYNGVDIGLGMGRRYSRRLALTLSLMSRLHAGFWTLGPAAAASHARRVRSTCAQSCIPPFECRPCLRRAARPAAARRVPLGQKLIEERLADEFSTSRTPVREALRRLEGDGHLVRAPEGGLRPSVPNVKSMSQFYEVRIALEELSVRRAATAGDRSILEELRAEWRGLRSGAHGPDFVHADERFHRRLARPAATRSPRACSATSMTASASCASTTSRPTTACARRSP